MKELDCATPRGRLFIAHQRKVVDVLSERDPRMGWITSPDLACPWDFIGYRMDTGTAAVVMEVKSREMAGDVPFTEQYLRESGYLITMEKIMDLAYVADMIRVPAVLAVNIVPERKVALITIWRPGDGKVSDFQIATTETQATCNGGTASRQNAFIEVNEKNLKVYAY